MAGQPHWSLSEDGTTLSVDLPTDPPTRFVLDADGVDEMIHMLGQLRLGMPTIDMSDPEIGSQVRSVGTRWYISSMPDGSKMLMIYDPAFRWVGIILDRQGISQAIEILQKP